MTDEDTQDSDSMTHEEMIAYIIQAYDVPINLVRYERLEHDTIGMVGPTTKTVSG